MTTLFTKQKPVKTDEELELLENIHNLVINLKALHQNYEYATDPKLIDSYIYEMSALYAKHDYYVQLCKKKDILVSKVNMTRTTSGSLTTHF